MRYDFKNIYTALFIDILSLIPGLGWDEEFGSKLEEIENKAQVPQAHHLAKVLDALKEPRAGHWTAIFFSICKFISPFLTQQEYWFSC